MSSDFPLRPMEEFDNATIDPFMRQSSNYPGRLPFFQEITANSHPPTQEEFNHAMINNFIRESSDYPGPLPVFRERTAYSHLPTQEEFDNATIGPFTGESFNYPGRFPVFREITASSNLPDEEFENDSINSSIWRPSGSQRRPSFSPEIAANSGYRNTSENCRCRGNCRLCHFPLTTERETMGGDAALELDLVYLLRSRAGQPVPISMLPVLFLEMYKRPIQAEGYLTDRQRQGRTGMNLTALLLRFRNQIQIIHRPHGQHDVILVGDYSRYVENRSRREYLIPGSLQIGDNIYVGRRNFGRDEASTTRSHETLVELNSNLHHDETEHSSIEGYKSSSSETVEEDNVYDSF